MLSIVFIEVTVVILHYRKRVYTSTPFRF